MNTSPLPRDLEFPEDQDPEAFHSTSVIGGEFGITAELPKLEDIIEWQEGRRKFTRGYYRLVEGPQLFRLQQGFSRHFSIRHAIAFSSLPSALLELLELLFNRYEESRLKVIWEHLDPGFSFLVNSLQSLRRPVTYFPGNLYRTIKSNSRRSLLPKFRSWFVRLRSLHLKSFLKMRITGSRPYPVKKMEYLWTGESCLGIKTGK